MLSGYSGPHDSCLVLVMWYLSPEGTLVDCHPGTKRFLGLLCFSYLPVQPYGTWLSQESLSWEVHLVTRQADVAEYRGNGQNVYG